jgi:Domain of unknown function (DUF4407)
MGGGVAVGRFLIFLSGAQASLLDECPTERPYFFALGEAILIPSVLAGVSLAFALASVLNVNHVTAAVFGFLWGVSLLLLTRMLVVAMPHGRRGIFFALPYIALSLVLSLVVTTPLTLQIFRPEIRAQIILIQHQQADAFERRLDNSATAKEISRLSETIAAYQKIIASDGAASLSPSLDTVTQQLIQQRSHLQAVAQAAYKKWQCELYGGPGCPSSGNGQIARTDEDNYQAAETQVSNITTLVLARAEQLSSTAAADKELRLALAQKYLPSALQLLSSDQNAQKEEQASFAAANRSDNGLLVQLQALSQVSSQNATLSVARFLLYLLFTAIGCLPVAVNLLRRPGLYETMLAEQEKVNLAVRQAEYRYSSIAQGMLEQVADRGAPGTGHPHRPVGGASDDADAADRALRGMADMRGAGYPDYEPARRAAGG